MFYNSRCGLCCPQTLNTTYFAIFDQQQASLPAVRTAPDLTPAKQLSYEMTVAGNAVTLAMLTFTIPPADRQPDAGPGVAVQHHPGLQPLPHARQVSAAVLCRDMCPSGPKRGRLERTLSVEWCVHAQTSGVMAGRKTCDSNLAELASWLMMWC